MSIRSTSMASMASMAGMASGGAGATSQQTLAAASSCALIGSRDGIVGRYTDPIYTPAADDSVGLPHLSFDSIDMLEFRESDVRHSYIHIEIRTDLRFTSSGGDTVIISDRSGTAGEMSPLVTRAACAALLARPEAIGTPDAGGVMKAALLGATDPWTPGPFAPGSGLAGAPARIGAGVLSARFSKSPPRFEDSRSST